jgi:hypothetical protein
MERGRPPYDHENILCEKNRDAKPMGFIIRHEFTGLAHLNMATESHTRLTRLACAAA